MLDYHTPYIKKYASCVHLWVRVGNRQQATGNWQQATGNWQLATGNRQLATGNWQQLWPDCFHFSRLQKTPDARFFNLKPLFDCTLSGKNSPYALINQCFTVIQQALLICLLGDLVKIILPMTRAQALRP